MGRKTQSKKVVVTPVPGAVSKFAMMTKGSVSETVFNKHLARIVSCPAAEKVCGDIAVNCRVRDRDWELAKGAAGSTVYVHKKTGRRQRTTPEYVAISPDYVREYMLQRTTHIMWYQTRVVYLGTKSQRMDGFLLGHVKEQADGKRTFYIDLVCSKHRKGKALISQAETVAASLRCSTTSLRAASPELIPIYRRMGYERKSDACVHSDRAQRARLRSLDRKAVAFEGRSWLGYDGWWMSKCVEGVVRRSTRPRRPLTGRT